MARTEVSGLEEPRLARFLFNNPKAGWVWLIPRLYFGYEWVHAGYDKVFGVGQPSWLTSAEPLKGFAGYALTGAAKGPHSPVNYGWYAAFLRWVGGGGAGVMSKVISVGELAIGVALIVGLFTGIAAFFAGTLTMSFGLAGVAGVNPVFFLFEVLFILAWRVVGEIGLDRFVLPLVGTPWNPGRVLARRKEQPAHQYA